MKLSFKYDICERYSIQNINGGVWDIFWFTSESARALNPHGSSSECRHRKMSVFQCVTSFSFELLYKQLLSIWDFGKRPKAHTSGYLLFKRRKVSVYMYSIYFALRSRADSLLTRRGRKMSEFCCKLFFPAKLMYLSYIYSCLFCPSVSVGSPAAESVFTVFHLRRMENDVNFCLPQIHSARVSSTANFLSRFFY